MTMIDIEPLRPWLGRSEIREDILTPGLIERFRATLDGHLWGAAGTVPLGIHWCLAPDAAPTAALGADGHAAKGGFLPPVPLPSRMWAGGEIVTRAPLGLGQTVTRRSTIADIAPKTGRSGTLVFVTVRHDYSSGGRVCISERQDIVYRDISAPRAAPPAGGDADPASLRDRLQPDPVLLFRYSALTFNGHRIHYDQPYATGAEAYPGLVVHGPLQATLLFNLAARMLNGAPGRFSFRGLAPVTLPCTLELHARDADAGGTVWCQDATGVRSFSADYAPGGAEDQPVASA